MPTAPEEMTLKVIAHIHTAFPTKFGIPRQSGLVDSLRGEVIFTPEYRSADAVRGLEDFSHIWLVWQFSGAVRDSWSPTVRPPRLGGNTRMGVFATRSPFRPNPLGLSSVKLEGIEMRPEVGPVLLVRGADLMDGTPIYDIKPYIPYADCHPDAAEGFTGQTRRHLLEVSCPEELWAAVPQADRDALRRAVNDDVIDVIATDHAPHLITEKKGGALKAVSGMPMVQFSLVSMLQLVSEGIFTIEKVVEKMCHAPAQLYGISERGFIREGWKADLVLVRPDTPWTLEKSLIQSKCGWSPLEGHTFDWHVERTFVNGHTVYDGREVDESYRGEALHFDR